MVEWGVLFITGLYHSSPPNSCSLAAIFSIFFFLFTKPEDSRLLFLLWAAPKAKTPNRSFSFQRKSLHGTDQCCGSSVGPGQDRWHSQCCQPPVRQHGWPQACLSWLTPQKLLHECCARNSSKVYALFLPLGTSWLFPQPADAVIAVCSPFRCRFASRSFTGFLLQPLTGQCFPKIDELTVFLCPKKGCFSLIMNELQ